MTTTRQPPELPEVGARSRWQVLAHRPESPAAIVLLVVGVLLSIIAPGFLTAANLQSVVVQSSIVALIALGVNQVVLAGEIDISMGSMLGLCAMLVGTVAVEVGGLLFPLLTGLLVGGAAGALNGFLVVKARIPAIVVGLGMLYTLRGLLLLISGGDSVSGIPLESRILGRDEVFGLHWALILVAAAAALLAVVGRHTTWGRDVYAVGGNRGAARLTGLAIDRTRFFAFLGTGLATGLASLVYIGRTGGVQPNAGFALELEIIAAVVIGGTSIAGGRGSTFAPLVGALLVGVILNGMVLMNVPGVWQDAVLGGLILLAISADGVRRRWAGEVT
ncbi:ABC transporter permease [Egibacter rhizosphaerae]|uniref:Autoinducer 2 import system permease protein LsrC n=1 Tax=Egibacter rhizosphaerae TaxID=1670831 RepID=A0A411YGJ5_9ACTN|nr:ABC transporter permease [Egibacter rhizosphaerae]QBI20202.1 ABC transporter permease [Egibacter rhizosphaerae]